MDATTAAHELYDQIGLPGGTVSVIAWPDGKAGYVLKVWVRSMEYGRDVPRIFHGYAVKVEVRPAFQGNWVMA